MENHIEHCCSYKSKERPDKEYKDLINRLSRIEGQVRGIKKMVENDTYCYKILFGTDGQNLEETDKLYNLTEAERELLESKRRGHALFMIGSKRLHVNFEIPDYKWAYFGKAGGR